MGEFGCVGDCLRVAWVLLEGAPEVKRARCASMFSMLCHGNYRQNDACAQPTASSAAVSHARIATAGHNRTM